MTGQGERPPPLPPVSFATAYEASPAGSTHGKAVQWSSKA